MNIRERLKKENIRISLKYYGSNDYATGWEVSALIQNAPLFNECYKSTTVTVIDTIDDYFKALLARKISLMEEIVPLLSKESDKPLLSEIIGNCTQYSRSIGIGALIQFINGNTRIIFEDEQDDRHDIVTETMDIIAQYSSNGISFETLEYICEHYGYLVLDRYDSFEKTLEQNSHLFEQIYPTGHLYEVDGYRFDETFKIWNHIINKNNTNLKDIVLNRINTLYSDMVEYASQSTDDQIMIVNHKCKKFLVFLQSIKNPKANSFKVIFEDTETKVRKKMEENGDFYEFSIPVGEIIKKWNETKDWIVKLVSLTHEYKNDDGDNITIKSRLDKEPSTKKHLFDLLSSNINADSYYTLNHQLSLDTLNAIGSSTFLGILRDPHSCEEYIKLLGSALNYISNKSLTPLDNVEEDYRLLCRHIYLVSSSIDDNEGITNATCYGLTMYLCSLTEKLLRVYYISLTKDEVYIPANKATLGELLNINNKEITSVFGEAHVKNLLFFLLQTQPAKIGRNIRNRMAHWNDIAPKDVTLSLAAEMMWLFTDVVNTIFVDCIRRGEDT